MSYISGHYRSGHYRNGKWVSGGYVKGHYRSGLAYGYSSYSVNANTTNATEEATLPNDIELEELLSPQNMKIISEMKGNLDNFSYARTLRFFEAYYPYDVENVHYAEVLLSMNICSSIDELISVREFVKEKITKISQSSVEKLPDDISKELSECVSKVLGWSDICFNRLKDNLRADVNSCYDENIFRLFKERKTITTNICGEFFINLSFCSKHSKYRDLISHEAKERGSIDVYGLLGAIAKRFKGFRTHWNEYKGFKEGMNGYNAAKQVVEDDFDYLKQFNWRLLPWEKSYYSEIDREEIRKKDEQVKIREDNQIEKERQKKEEEINQQGGEVRKRDEQIKIQKNNQIEKERQKKGEEINQQEEEFRKERNNTIIKIIIGVIVCVPIVILLVQIPSEVWNWIIAILFILALMKK